MNDDSDFLMLSGLKHFRFCRRRWALVHIEQQWEENALTLDGHYMHELVHDENFTEKRGSVLLSRGIPVRSEVLRITGACDMVELTQSDAGVPIQGREGRWLIYPVEYKRGRPDPTGADEWQLCAQALCLEEMFVTDIAGTWIETRRSVRNSSRFSSCPSQARGLKLRQPIHAGHDAGVVPISGTWIETWARLRRRTRPPGRAHRGHVDRNPVLRPEGHAHRRRAHRGHVD